MLLKGDNCRGGFPTALDVSADMPTPRRVDLTTNALVSLAFEVRCYIALYTLRLRLRCRIISDMVGYKSEARPDISQCLHFHPFRLAASTTWNGRHLIMSTKKTTANRYNFLIVFLVTFGSLTYGYNSAIIGAVLGLASFFTYFGIDLYGPNAAESSRITGATNGVFAAGGLLGCILMTWLGDAYGRKVAIQVTSVLCVAAGIIQAASVHIAMFLVGRFLMGVGVGMVNVITPLYQSEISPAHLRGRMVGTHGFILCVGYVSCFVSSATSPNGPGAPAYDLLIYDRRPWLAGRDLGVSTSHRRTHNGVCVSRYKSSLRFACLSGRYGSLSLRDISLLWIATMMAFEFCKICTGFQASKTIFWPGRNFTKSVNSLILRGERDGGRGG